MTFQEQYFQFIDELDFPSALPGQVEILNPFKEKHTYQLSKRFYHNYYNDENPRLFLIGINPGRFGAGVTGVPFTDPIRLETYCNIENNLDKRQELSSVFIYDMIQAYGGVTRFYKDVFFTSVSPLGFVKDGVNINYYDIPELRDFLEPFMLDSLRRQIKMGGRKTVAFSMGKGLNHKYLTKLNSKYHLFDEIKPLPHPRWIMQYRLKRKQEFIDEYILNIQEAIKP